MTTEKLVSDIVARIMPAVEVALAAFEKRIDAKLSAHGAESVERLSQQAANRTAEIVKPMLTDLQRELKSKIDDVGQEWLIVGTKVQEAVDGLAMTGASAKRAKTAAPKPSADASAAPGEKVPATALAYFKEQYRSSEEFRTKVLDMPGIRKAVTESKFVADKKPGMPKFNAEADVAFKSLEQTSAEWSAEFKREHAAKKAARTAADALASATTEAPEATTPQ